MSKSLMNNSHHTSAPWAWQIDAGQATTLASSTLKRWLRVESGCVWLTRQHSNADDRDADIWLAAGDSLTLPAGTAWVLQAWPRATLSLLEGAGSTASGGAWRTLRWARLLAARAPFAGWPALAASPHAQ